MYLNVLRMRTVPDSTLGAFYIDGLFSAFTLEDGARPLGKVAKETRIPVGIYRVGLRTGSPVADQYADKYVWHRWGMLWLLDVPLFTFVYIHPGNTHKNTDGCVLVGHTATARPDADGSVGGSVNAYKAVYERVAPTVVEQKRIGGAPVRCRVSDWA